MMTEDERVVVTGIGAIAAVGTGTAAYWEAIVKGTPGLDRITRFDPAGAACQVAGEARGFDPADYIDPRLIAQTDRWTQFGLAAADMAFADAAYDPAGYDPYRTSVITASAGGGNEFGQREIGRLWAEGPRSVGPYQSIAWFYAATTGQVAIHRGVKGPCGVVVSDGASGLDAIGRARRLLRRGAADAVLAGGTEAPVSPYAVACQNRSGRLSSGADPDTAYAPFTSMARGQVPGEGGAMLLLETMAGARRRAAPHVYAEIAGYSASHDGQPSGTATDGRQLARTIRAAVSAAGLEPDDIDAVFADGAAVPELDQAESAALSAVFGPRPVPVTVPKTMTGWLYSGGAALDVAAAALALDRAVLPPTVGPAALAPGCLLNIVRRATPMLLRHVLVVARGYGGFNAAVVVSHPLLRL
jgi:act minimal PKS chain-length factor (CLF/KS beta)